MTREEYLRALNDELGFMEAEPRRALLDFYGEMIADRMEDGMDEASAVAAMENPADIAARQRAEGPVPPREEGGGISDEAMRFSSLAGQLLRTFEDLDKSPLTPPSPPVPEKQEKPETPEPPKAPEAPKGQDFSEAVSGLLRSVEDMIEARTKEEPAGDYVKKTMTVPAASLRAVRLLCGDMPIQVKPAEGKDAVLVYYTRDDDPYEAEESNGVLTLQKKAASGEGRRFSFSLLGGVIRMGFNKGAPTTELYLPQDSLVDLEAHTSNASIKIQDVQGVCGLALKTNNGRIALEQVSCKSLTMTTSNARLALFGVKSRLGVQGKTSNGRIEVTGVKSGGDMVLTTSNGHISAKGASAKGLLRLATSNGGIDVEGLSASSLEIKSSNAGISGTLPGARQDWAIQSGTSNGKNSLPNNQPGPKPLSVHTSNGSISLRFEIQG